MARQSEKLIREIIHFLLQFRCKRTRPRLALGTFSFLYLKKQNFKNICRFWKFSEMGACRPPVGDRPLAWACRPSRGRQGPICNKNIYDQTSGDLFVIKISTSRLGGPVARGTGDRSPPPPSGDRPFPGLHVWSGRWLVAPVRFK